MYTALNLIYKLISLAVCDQKFYCITQYMQTVTSTSNNSLLRQECRKHRVLQTATSSVSIPHKSQHSEIIAHYATSVWPQRSPHKNWAGITILPLIYHCWTNLTTFLYAIRLQLAGTTL